MTLSKSGENLVKSFEQCRLRAFLPMTGDVPTIGWGATGPDVHLGLIWTQAQADTRFDQDAARFSYSVWMLVKPWGKTNQNQFDALCSLAYNVGTHALANSSLLACHRHGQYEQAAIDFGQFIHQKGRVVQGLVNRRKIESELYLKPM